MPKYFTIYCAALLIMLVFANYRGIIYSHYLTGQHQQAVKNASYYHK